MIKNKRIYISFIGISLFANILIIYTYFHLTFLRGANANVLKIIGYEILNASQLNKFTLEDGANIRGNLSPETVKRLDSLKEYTSNYNLRFVSDKRYYVVLFSSKDQNKSLFRVRPRVVVCMYSVAANHYDYFYSEY
jgi:hypothetical protein